MEIGKSAGMKESLLDRLKLTPDRIKGMAEGVRQVAALEDPVGEVISMWERPNGLKIGKKKSSYRCYRNNIRIKTKCNS